MADNEHKRHDLGGSLAKNLIAGGVSRCTATALLHPMDVVKTRLQFQRAHDNSCKLYKNGLHCLLSIIKHEGPRALFKGLAVKCSYILPASAITFTIYEMFKEAFMQKKYGWNLVAAFLIGACGRATMTMLRTPFDIVKQHLQVSGMSKVSKDQGITTTEKPPKLTVRRILELIRDNQGHKGYFTGVTVTIARDCFFSGSYFFSYEIFKYILPKVVGVRDSVNHMISGGGAGCVATVISLPVDVVKTRIQTQAHLPPELRSIANTVLTMWKVEGPKTFMRGLGPRLVQTIPSASLTFTIYEKLKSVLEHSQANTCKN